MSLVDRVKGLTGDETRCRWPECHCYTPQGPQECRRLSVSPLAQRWAYLDEVDARRALLQTKLNKEDR